MSITTTPIKTQASAEAWSQYLQRRVMRLLLLHDQHLFQGAFRTFFAGSSLTAIPIFQLYDEHIKLLTYSGDLLSDILPRIKQQWKQQVDHLTRQEETPTRGEIDWTRTLTRTFHEAPNQPPLRFDTIQQLRHSSIPENILVVAILRHLRQTVRTILNRDQQEELFTTQERQQLVTIDEQLERELAAPDLRTLIGEASRYDLETLVQHVTKRLRSGVNAYRDLLLWWEEFSALHIGQGHDQRHQTLGSRRKGEQADQWLYEVWIALEILTLLQQEQAILPETLSIEVDRLTCSFTWNEQHYRFSFQRQQVPTSGTQAGWRHVPLAHPNFTIEREQPLTIEYKETIIWQEPPFVMLAAYSTRTNSAARCSEAIQRLMGSMQLHHATHGAIFFPPLQEPPQGQHVTREVIHDEQTYAPGTTRQTSISFYKLTPDVPNTILQERLHATITHAIACLPEREQLACHGIMLDGDSVNCSHDTTLPYNVICPKPHIGRGVFDLVNREQHCNQDPRVCHAIERITFLPSIKRANNLDELKQRISEFRTFGEQLKEQAKQGQTEQQRSEILNTIGEMIEKYVQTRGSVALQEKYYRDLLFGEYWKQHPRCLAEETRNILLSGEYVWDEYQETGLRDWAAPAIQYCRALERELKRRLYDPDQASYNLSVRWTIGTPSYLYSNRSGKSADRQNWQVLLERASKSGTAERELEAIMRRLTVEKMADLRNGLAHGRPVDQQTAQAIKDIIIGRKGEQGILCWLAEHIDIK
ncbi:hypothetical protein KDH_11860 [Dictyobacter sp. S3.2.2.5]|uniref:Uncharacterized protein n=1 Tax=Dictyobacter halimunensis TaxID=3026934 RepID=A0ABQ6FKW2_9CHLR|nr:hypothetical protein KDH_11860 [Dictyobacter sp. S3.2.2.5]